MRLSEALRSAKKEERALKRAIKARKAEARKLEATLKRIAHLKTVHFDLDFYGSIKDL